VINIIRDEKERLEMFKIRTIKLGNEFAIDSKVIEEICKVIEEKQEPHNG
jgi:hypothetical protein